MPILLSPFQLQITASVRERPLRATWELLLWPTWFAAAVHEPMPLFVTERGFRGPTFFFVRRQISNDMATKGGVLNLLPRQKLLQRIINSHKNEVVSGDVFYAIANTFLFIYKKCQIFTLMIHELQ